MTNLHKLFYGTHVKHPKIHEFRCKKIEVASENFTHLEIDGESVGKSPANFEVIPSAIQVITTHRDQANRLKKNL